MRPVDALPFVPQDPHTLDERCTEIVAIQTAGLAKRLEHTGLKRVLMGSVAEAVPSETLITMFA